MKPGLTILEADRALRHLRRASLCLRAVLDTVKRETWYLGALVDREAYRSAAERAAFGRVAVAVGRMLQPYAEAQEAIIQAQRGNLGRE
jgi:hypothetical protein